jgi:hypothetical protein
MFAAGSLLLAVILHVMAAHQAKQGLTPMVTDFNTFYAIHGLLADHPAASAYDPTLIRHAEILAATQAYPGPTAERFAQMPTFLWLYPPTATLLMWPLGALPYWIAYAAWGIATLAVWLGAVRRICPDPAALPVALALPATFINGMFGQMGFLTAGLLGWGLVLLVERPILAGIAFGLLTVKPHFGLFLPIALLCGGHWRAVGAACATALALAGASVAVFGVEPWAAFLTHAGQNSGALMETGAVPWSLMPTVFPALRLLGLSVNASYAGQGVAALLALASVMWSWRRPGPPSLQACVLCLATLLALPFAYAYDLTVLALPLFWLAADGFRTRLEAALVILAALLPLLAAGLGKLGVPVAPLVIGALLAVTLRRQAREP